PAIVQPSRHRTPLRGRQGLVTPQKSRCFLGRQPLRFQHVASRVVS
ncbi:unnamed protein product, partial [Mycena citricolor]